MKNGKSYKRNRNPNSAPVSEVGKKTKEVIREKINGLVLISYFIIVIRKVIAIVKVDEI